MASEEYAYGLEDGYADARRGRVEVPAGVDEYRRGYEAGVAACVEEWPD